MNTKFKKNIMLDISARLFSLHGRKVKTEGIPELITGSGKVYHRLIWPQVWLEKYPRKVPMRAEKLSCVSLVNL